MANYTETDSNGKPIQKITIKHAVRDLLGFSPEMVVALCAALIVAHESGTWPKTLESIKKCLEEGNG